MSKEDRDKGFHDGKTGKESTPPGNSDWVGIFTDQVFGNTKTDDYLTGYHEGQQNRDKI